MFSRITRLRRSMFSRPCRNSGRSLRMSRKNVPPNRGITSSTNDARCQSSASRMAAVPRMTTTDVTCVGITCETNSFTASISEVRLVSSRAGVRSSMKR